MPSSGSFLNDILLRIGMHDDITYRQMMGEYILYCRGKIFGGIYDDRFLVKDTPSSRRLMPDADRESPYDGAKEMLAVPDSADREFLTELIESMYGELPDKKRKGSARCG